MRNTIFATAIAMAGCVFAAAAYSSELPVAWQVDLDLDTTEYQLENTPDLVGASQEYNWDKIDWSTNVN